MENKNYLGGGKLGDFIHGLCVCKYVWEKNKEKANIFISNQGDNFEKSLTETINDLLPVLSQQEWFNSIDIYQGQDIDINLVSARQSPLLYKTSWIDLYFKEFLPGEDVPKDYYWINIKEKEYELKDVVLFNRSLNRSYIEKNEIYRKIIEKHKKCAFICFNLQQYENFPHKDLLPILVPNSLYDFFVKLNSCKCYVGNLTGPTAWATSLNIPRVVELSSDPNDLDRPHYLNDTKYYTKFKFF